jgi:hypothetical protein
MLPLVEFGFMLLERLQRVDTTRWPSKQGIGGLVGIKR